MQGGGKSIGLGALNEHPTDMGIAGFGESALVARLPARRFHRDESQKAHHLAGMGELAEVSTFGNDGSGG